MLFSTVVLLSTFALSGVTALPAQESHLIERNNGDLAPGLYETTKDWDRSNPGGDFLHDWAQETLLIRWIGTAQDIKNTL